MKIGIVKINGASHIPGTLPATDSAGNSTYIIADTLPITHNDITSIENWDEIGAARIGAFKNFRDWKKLRSEISAMVDAVLGMTLKNWDTFTQVQQDAIIADFQDNTKFNDKERGIAAKYFVVPLDLQLLVNNNIDYWIRQGADFFHPQSVLARTKRYSLVLAQVFTRLKKADAKEIEKEINQVIKGQQFSFDTNNKLTQKVQVKTLRESYIQAGVESFTDDGQVGFVDYTDSTVGTVYEGNGVKSKGFTVKGMTDMIELGDKLKDILLKGND